MVLLTSPYLNEVDVGLIQGIQPGSDAEWYVALALWNYRLEFDYQKPVFRGSSLLGGTIVDFWVKSAPFATALFVDGEHWHRGKQRELDVITRINLKQYFRNEVRVVELFASDAHSYESAKAQIRQLFRV